MVGLSGTLLSGFESGPSATERFVRLRDRLARLDGVHANLLDALCADDGRSVDRFFRTVAPSARPAADARGLESLLSFVEALRDGTVRCRVEREGGDVPPAVRRLTLAPAGRGAGDGAAQVLAAVEANAVDVANLRERAVRLQARREAVLAARRA